MEETHFVFLLDLVEKRGYGAVVIDMGEFVVPTLEAIDITVRRLAVRHCAKIISGTPCRDLVLIEDGVVPVLEGDRVFPVEGEILRPDHAGFGDVVERAVPIGELVGEILIRFTGGKRSFVFDAIAGDDGGVIEQGIVVIVEFDADRVGAQLDDTIAR